MAMPGPIVYKSREQYVSHWGEENCRQMERAYPERCPWLANPKAVEVYDQSDKPACGVLLIDEEKASAADDFKPSNPKDIAAMDRLDLSLVPSTALVALAVAFSEGDWKYGGYNFRNVGVSASTYDAAEKRHQSKWYNGEDLDPKTGIPHLWNAIACLAVLIDAIECGKLNDDRPPKVDIGGMIDRAQGIIKKFRENTPRGKNRRFTVK